jgi:hypothetical protein
MPKSKLVAMGLIASLLSPAMSAAEDVRYYNENGVDYRETRRVVTRPVTETEWTEKEKTVYREEYSTEVSEASRVVHVPVTEYRWEARWKGLWNPFGRPYMVQELVPYTRFEAREEVVRTPVTQRHLVPETRVVRVPVTRRYMREEEVINRVAVTPRDAKSGVEVARRPQGIGGVENLAEPPRSASTRR